MVSENGFIMKKDFREYREKPEVVIKVEVISLES